jgi:hypothetical protein
MQALRPDPVQNDHAPLALFASCFRGATRFTPALYYQNCRFSSWAQMPAALAARRRARFNH